jgi:phosphonate transport system substrate-binding protein
MCHLLLIYCLSTLFLLTSCATQQTAGVVSLTELEPLPLKVPTETIPLRVAIAAVISPKGNVDSYGPLLEYLGEELNRPVKLVQRRTYAEINELIKNGEVDIGFVCTSAYVAGARDFGMELLAAPQVAGETVYYSLLIVPTDSQASSMADLRGSVFAFTDPMSNSGRNYPTHLVLEMGQTPEQFFRRTFFTYSHDDAIRAVANRVADGAAVDSLVYAYTVSREPELGQKTKIIHSSPPFGIPPVVVGPHVRPQSKAELRAILMAMDENPAGRSALATASIDSFVSIEDSAYETVRILEAQISSQSNGTAGAP